jgi:serine/threonine protein kinase
MATVHRAKTVGVEGFETVVAVKRILPHLAEDAEFTASFVREAKLAALLNHPNIVHIHDFGKIDGTYFIAMEYISGQTLLQVLRWERVVGPPPPEVVLSIVIELCEALDYAHRLRSESGEPLRIVHRDLSPSNLMIDDAGHLTVIDFGIAKGAPAELETSSGMVKGKHGYMSPEALRARGVDARSDVFSTGVIAHELLTGRRLFSAKDDYETLRRIMHGAIQPPSLYNPHCPRELDDIVMRALERDPKRRWQTAGDMRDALENVALLHSLRPTHRRVAEWVAQASALRPVMLSAARREPPEPSPLQIVVAFPEDATTTPRTPVTPQTPQTPVTPVVLAPSPYIVLETATGPRLKMLEGDPKPTTDLRLMLDLPTPPPRPEVVLPRPEIVWPTPMPIPAVDPAPVIAPARTRATTSTQHVIPLRELERRRAVAEIETRSETRLPVWIAAALALIAIAALVWAFAV